MMELWPKYPWVLLLWIPVVILWQLGRTTQRRAALTYSSVDVLKSLPVTWMQRLKGWLPWLRLLALMLIVYALARPQKGIREFRVQTEGIAMQMCLDRSGSMEALDFEIDGEQVNRLTIVKKVFGDFVGGGDRLPGRPDDLIGLIVFGGFAEAMSPLTLDHGALLQALEAVKIPQPIQDSRGRIINERLLQEELSTAIGDAVALAVDRIKDAKAKSKVVILLSDGESNAGVVTPEEAADAAKAFGVKIYTIGVGTTGRAPFPAVDVFGRRVLQARPVRLDETTLKMLADKTGGQYFNAQDTETLRRVYAEIDKLEKTKSEGRLYTEYEEVYLWFLLPGVALILLELLLATTRFRSLP